MTDAAWRARTNHYHLAYQDFPLENLPLSGTNIGPGSISLLLGARPQFYPDTVWYHPCIDDISQAPPLSFVPDNHWWRVHEAIIREQLRLSNGAYLVSCPDLVENIDILSSLRGAERLMVDLLLEPDWVRNRLFEINQVFFEAYTRVYDLIRDETGGASFGAFSLWGLGKTAKVQADASAMLSPAQFEEFVAPPLRQQCRWLDFSLFHLDGTQCIPHLDILLEIDELHAIEWTPQDGRPSGGSPEWYGLCRRILNAGKSLQAVGVRPEEVEPLLNAIGTNGVYLLVDFRNSPMTLAEFTCVISRYRRRL
jgi:hypothetical protein